MMFDGVLVTATLFSLVLAIVMSITTWRLFRLEPRQPASPAAPEAPQGWPSRPARRQTARFSERQPQPVREAARPAAPASQAGDGWSEVVIQRTITLPSATAPAQAPRVAHAPAPHAPAEPARIHAVSVRPPAAPAQRVIPVRYAEPRNRRQYAVAAGLGTIALVIGVGSALLFSGGPFDAGTLSPAAARVNSPLELVSLECERGESGLAIRGLVRNPAVGSEMRRLEAVAFLFDRRGVFVGTTHAPVSQGVLGPGAESTFEIPLAASVEVSRYRVSFRVASAPVPHIDRRSTPASTPAPAPPARPHGLGGDRAAHLISS